MNGDPIDKVWHMPRGSVERVADIVAQNEYEVLVPLRHSCGRKVRGEEMLGGESWYECFECGQPLYFIGLKNKRQARHTYYFRHPPQGGECHLKQHDRVLTLREIDALRFHGQQEGARHRRLKWLIAQTARADPAVSNVVVETRITSTEGPWRKPDVAFERNGMRFAAEAQLASTALTTILERQAFYRDQSQILLWFVDVVPDLYPRIYLKDLQVLHGGVFCINDTSLEQSVEKRSFSFFAYDLASEPDIEAATPERSAAMISLDQLTFEPQRASARWIQPAAAQVTVPVPAISHPQGQTGVSETRASPSKAGLAEAMDRFFAQAPMANERKARALVFITLAVLDRPTLHFDPKARATFDQDEWFAEVADFDNIDLPPRHDEVWREYAAITVALLSARMGKPVWWNFQSLAPMAHHLHKVHPGCLWYFKKALERFGVFERMLKEDVTHRLSDKFEDISSKWRLPSTRQQFASDAFSAIAAWLVPEEPLFERKRRGR